MLPYTRSLPYCSFCSKTAISPQHISTPAVFAEVLLLPPFIQYLERLYIWYNQAYCICNYAIETRVWRHLLLLSSNHTCFNYWSTVYRSNIRVHISANVCEYCVDIMVALLHTLLVFSHHSAIVYVLVWLTQGFPVPTDASVNHSFSVHGSSCFSFPMIRELNVMHSTSVVNCVMSLH